MQKTIYRIQDKDGRGPFKPGFSHKWTEDRPDHMNLVPWALEFGNVLRGSIRGMSIGCGCTTVEQLKRWFTQSEYSKLLTFGYRAVKMDVGRVLGESNIQCVFERCKPLKEDVEPFDLYPPQP